MTSPSLVPSSPETVGCIEASGGASFFGWAWCPASPEVRVLVALVLDGAEIASVAADGFREDLATNRVGDGRHAFVLPVPSAHADRWTEMVVRTSVDGVVSNRLERMEPVDPMTARYERMMKGMETVVASQRVLHRNVQEVLMRTAASVPGTEEREEGFAERLRSLEIFMVRLDEILARGSGTADAHAKPNGGAAWRMVAVGVVSCALGACSVALYASLGW